MNNTTNFLKNRAKTYYGYVKCGIILLNWYSKERKRNKSKGFFR